MSTQRSLMDWQVVVMIDRSEWRPYETFQSKEQAELAARIFAHVGARTQIRPVPREADEGGR